MNRARTCNPRARKPHTTGGMITANRVRSFPARRAFPMGPEFHVSNGCFYLPLSSPMFFILYFSLSPHIPKKKKNMRENENEIHEKEKSNQINLSPISPLLLHQRR